MLERLPAPGGPFPRAERELWLKIMADVFELIYPEADPNEPVPMGTPPLSTGSGI